MRKITTTIAAIALSVSISANDTLQKEHKTIEYTIMDLIDGIKMDMYYGYLEQDRGNYYINEILKIKSINRDLMVETYKLKKIANQPTIIYNKYE
tara:strand:- start:26 stop:310 length:285 start_codon:yes stop_codon:yes gene_type:complete